MVKINGIYKHFKGNFYIVLDVAIHSETNEKYKDVKQEYRFELQNIPKN